MNYNYFWVPVFLLFLTPQAPASAQFVLPQLISDGMVLQRDTDVRIWGWSGPGQKIDITFSDSLYSTTADDSGEWTVYLHPVQAGGPYTLHIESDTRRTVENIMAGDVWVASGQSNMELPMERVAPLYQDEISSANYPDIRFFNVPQRYNFDHPERDLPWGEWVSVDTSSIHHLSAAAYFFARHLHETTGVPVGIFHSSLGGSPAEAWMSEEALKSFPVHYREALRFKEIELIRQIETADQQRISAWYKASVENDAGYNDTNSWYTGPADGADWKTMRIPGYWADEDVGPVNGVMWFRRDVDIPESMAGRPARLELGRIVDADSTYINGVFVGNTTYQYPPRWYVIPDRVLLEGSNVITVRVTNERGRGGFVCDKPYEITAGTDTINLTGEWKYRPGTVMEPLESQTFIRWKPLGLYNAMIAPLTNYAIKGVIWYQGESNAGRPMEYQKLFPAMIKNWRESWNLGDFPFIFVQLANYKKPSEQPTDSDWARLRDAQLNTLQLPHTGMAVAIDTGEWNDIHPLNKKDVGDRLALAARRIAFNEALVHSGPVYQSMQIEGDRIRLSFDHTGSGLTAMGDGDLHHFAIAGDDRVFVWAKAEIEGDEVVVRIDEIKEPLHVRYAWADNPDKANLYNKEGLPASPFRTDTW